MSVNNIVINNHREIFAIQEEFSKIFPYLKLEFFSKPNKSAGSSLKKLIKTSGKTLTVCGTINNEGNINISPIMTVTELEQSFSDVYGIVVHVLRKSGKIWLEATVTHGWTLEEQNNQGETLSKVVT